MKFCISFLLLCITIGLSAQSDNNWFMGRTDQAPVQSASSTAELVEAQFGGNYLYPPAYVLDGKGENTWCPGGRGIGQSITLVFAEAVSFDEIQIVNGFAGANDLYLKNNRIKSIGITQIAGKHFQNQDYDLTDKQAGWQSIKFPLDQTAATIIFTIREVYRGYKYDDTCLSDIRFLYKGKVIPYQGVPKLISLQTTQSKVLLDANSEKGFTSNYLDCLLVSDDKACYFFDPPSLEGETFMEYGQYSEETRTMVVTAINSYTISRNRIVTEQTVGYVKAKVSLVFVPDGKKGVTINGVYYHRIDKPADLKIDSSAFR